MYKFEKINEDTYKLITSKKEFTFTRTIDLIKELQSRDIETTMVLADILAERGETFENTKLKVERKVGNQTIIDETNFNEVKKQAQNIAYYNILNRVFKKIFGIEYIQLINEVEIDPADIPEMTKFITELTNVLVYGIKEDTPSE